MFKTFLTLTGVIICLLSIATDASHENNGTTNYPIWSELSYFERSTLGDLPKSYNNEPNALLALYLLASGVRDISSFDAAQKKIKTFVKNTQKLIIDQDNRELMGEIINREMHNNFFKKNDQKLGVSNAYLAEQSRLMGIFENGVFNCISSSLLYTVLARHFDLNIEGVLLPSHAFIQLNLNGGQAIDIETTSHLGFDQKHNEDFYKKQNNEWSSERGLDPATYQDYLNRTLVSPTILGAQNMLNQHTARDKMEEVDAGRLAEISAYIDPSNLVANEKRLYFYATEINHLINTQQWSTLLRLYDTTYQPVMSDTARLMEPESLQHNLRLYLSGAMLAYAKVGNIEQTLEVMGELLSRGLNSPENQNEIENRVINAVKTLLIKLADQHRYNEGLLALTLIEGHLSNPSVWPEMLSWFYLRWIKKSWNDKDWQEVIEILKEYLEHPNPDLEHNHVSKTIAGAYTNWVVTSVQNKDFAGAKAIVDRCRDSSHSHVCVGALAAFKNLTPKNDDSE